MTQKTENQGIGNPGVEAASHLYKEISKEAEPQSTKERILEVAGRMFMQYGYNGTTFQKIADELNITKGSITYHFKNKFFIVEVMIDDFFRQIKEYIDSFPDEYENAYWRQCVVYIYLYRRIMRSTRNKELFYHKDQQNLWQNHKVNVVSQVYEEIEKNFHKSYDLEDLRMKVYIDMGARTRLFQVYEANPGLLSLDQYCYYHIYLIGILCKLDEMTIQENIQNAFYFANSHKPVIVTPFE